MGRLSLITFVLFIIIVSVNAQQTTNTSVGWDTRSPDVTNNFNDIITLNRSSSIVVGDGGMILQTYDNGSTWNSLTSGTTSDLFAIAHKNNVTVVAGAGGTLLLNTSSGWQDISPTTLNLYAIDIPFVNSTITTIVTGGANGELWKTNDAGGSWVDLNPSTTSNINDISFYNATYGLLVGDNGLIMGTLDGTSFSSRDVPATVQTTNFNAVDFYSAIRAFVVGDNGIFLRSDISETPYTGFSWQVWDTRTTNNLLDLDATSSNKIFIVGTNSTILLTKDGGNSFKTQKSEISGIGLNAISMADSFFGFIAGNQGKVLFTDREGTSVDELPKIRDFSNFAVYWKESSPLIFEGFVNMLRIIFLSMLFGFTLGVTLAVAKTLDFRVRIPYYRYKTTTPAGAEAITPTVKTVRKHFEFKPIAFLATIYIDFFRNTPLLVQFFVIHFGFPELGIDLTFGGLISSRAFASSLIALSLNSGAYQAEIIRSGIQAIPTGQMEAGRSVGLTYGQTMRYVILPQAIRVVIPPLGNEFVNLTLNSSLASVTGYFELTRAGRLIIAITFLNFETWVIIAMFYFVITYTLTNILRYIEKRTRIPGLGLSGGN